MNIREYFSEHTGTGVLATASREGVVNTAIYARPHFLDDSTLGFIMRDKLTRKNLLENNHASYLFHEDGKGYAGVRLRLKLVRESTDHALLSKPSRSVRERKGIPEIEGRFLMQFSLEKCFDLIGGEEIPMEL